MNTNLKAASALFAGMLALAGCSGSAGDAGPAGPKGDTGDPGQDLVAAAKPESCAVCHSTVGADHQTAYNAYKDASRLQLTINSVASVDPDLDGTFTSTMTVTITKDGQPYVDAGLAALGQKTFYAATYDDATHKFNTTVQYTNPTATGTAGVYTLSANKASNGSTGTNVSSPLNFRPEDGPAIAFGYVADGPMTFEAFTVYDNVAHDGQEFGTVSYVSAANDSGCQKCHGTPYRKHGYRVAATPDLDDFASCKICHYDTRNGGHQGWQLLVDDPLAYANQEGVLTTEQKTRYAYKASVMNDVHMSHAMEFAYPQSMANCVTCHDGKLGAILTDANFTLATCKSCHPVTGPSQAEYVNAKRAPALATILPATIHGGLDLYAGATCNGCHAAGNLMNAPVFSAIHTGRNKMIYNSAGTKYSDVFTVSIDDASLTGNVLTVKFSAHESPDDPALAVTSIKPTVIIGLYGYDTKDFIVSAHGRDDGVNRNLEWVVGTTHPRFTTVSAAGGSWEITANLSDWADMITTGVIRRAEIAVLPELKDAGGTTLALDAPSRTFNLGTKAFTDGFYPAIVKVDGCNKCHEALATTFHSGNRGGNVVVCRLCHTTREGGGHLEMQSRSIDSYVHAIHSFQPFDISDIDFSDPVEALRYGHHIESTYPNFTLMNCESCHNSGTYEVPDQSRSLPGVHSAAEATTNWDRNIGAVPSYVTGPASRACGGCHRAELINEDNAGGLAAFNEHTSTFGYLLENTTGVLDAAIEKIMAVFK